MNANGEVVGISTLLGDGEEHAFLWTPADGMVDLGTLGGTRSVAQLVTANGQVFGVSALPGDVEEHAVLWIVR